MPPFDSVLIVAAVGAVALFALARVPRIALATLLTVAALAQAGAIGASSLPLAGQVSGAADSVSAWQQERIDAGACYFGTMDRLAGADPSVPIEPPGSCEPAAPAEAGTAAIGTISLP